MTHETGDHDPQYDTRIFDFHLRGGQSLERRLIQERIAENEQLHAQFGELCTVIDALSKCPAHSAPADLHDKVKARLAQTAPLQIKQPRISAAIADEPRILRLQSWRELTAVAAMIVIAVGMGVPSLLQMRERGQRVACSNNLAHIGAALQAYSAVAASLPFAGWSGQDSWLSGGASPANTVPNRRHLYPLVAGHYVNAAELICPSGTDVAMTDHQVASCSDFVESRNVSYAYQNMSGVRPDPHGPGDMPIMGDNNPLFSGSTPVLSRLGISHESESNSPAHHGQGQNLLTLDGHVIWTTTPDCGVQRDNIWTLQGVDSYTGREGPTTATDTQLLK
jgi:type II secretory pathway pseudopilin PulG